MLDWIEDANKTEEYQDEILSYFDYMDYFNENPKQECRPTFLYLFDMINSFDQEKDDSWKLFSSWHPDSPPVFGQKKVYKSIIQNFKNFQEEGFNNKFILLVGPNGSSKSSIIRKVMTGAEEYSKMKEGRLYTFSWVFPIDNYVKGPLGLTSTPQAKEVTSFAYLEDKDISAILASELKDHPLLLIPKEYRQKIIEDKFADDPARLDSLKKSFLFHGDLSKKNRLIYDALLKNYKGNHTSVLKHIRVERFNISKRYSSGAVTIEPQLHVDARMQQITMDRRLGSLPPSLQSLNLFSMQGEMVLANRGVLEYSDLLKRPLDTFKYLLMTMETKNINISGVLTELDIFFIGTSNEIHLAAFKQHPDFNSFKGRLNIVRVPYLLDYYEEQKIYREQIDGLKDLSVFEPHALKALCQFSIMTRIRQSQAKNFSSKKVGELAQSLGPLDKVKLYGQEKRLYPKSFDVESKQILQQSIDKIFYEFANENLYEGKFGISPRDVKNVIYKLSSFHKNITFIEVLEFLGELILKKNEYDFLNMNPQGDYHHPARFLALLKEDFLNAFDHELRESLGMVDDRSYEDYIRKYIENINAIIKKEKVKNPITGKFEEPNSYFVKEFEANINLKEDPKKFQEHLISKLGAYYLDNPGVDILYTDVFPDLMTNLKESFRGEQKNLIQTVSKNLVFFEAELADEDSANTPLSKENRELIETIINNLQSRYGYSQSGAIRLVKYLLKERY